MNKPIKKAEPTELELSETILRILGQKKPQTTKELVDLVNENKSWSKEKIIDAISDLQAQGRIKLISPDSAPLSSFSSYLKHREAIWFWVVLLVAVSTMSLAFLINQNSFPLSYIRNVLGIIFVLCLPGYVFIKALFPINASFKGSSTFGTMERIALSIIMSLVLVAIICLILNFSPWGINITSIVLSLLTFSSAFAIIAVIREYNSISKM